MMRRFGRMGECTLPTRADSGSAGYDFYSIKDFDIAPKETVLIPTNVKAIMQQDEVLLLFVRSSIGIKKHIVLSNGTGVIDSTFEDNIQCALYNYGETTQHINKGDRIMQGVFVKYLTIDDDNILCDKRNGGIGSTGE